jgi:hypothetical protein
LFESALANQRNDINQALDKNNEAMKLESDNTIIIKTQIRLLIAKGDCVQAHELTQKHANYQWFDEEFKLAYGQSLSCLGKWSEYQKIVDSIGIKKSSLRKYWLFIEVERFIAFKNYAKAIEALNLIKKMDDKAIEALYWSWKIQSVQRKTSLILGRDYVSKCKNISSQQYRQYLLDPLICRHVQEVTTELKGQNGFSD